MLCCVLFDEVNGPGGVACPGYVPTRHELLQLVRYWITEFLRIETFFFFEGQVGSADWRTSVYAVRRLNRIVGVLGREAVDAVVSDVKNEFRSASGIATGKPSKMAIWRRRRGSLRNHTNGHDRLRQKHIRAFCGTRASSRTAKP